MYTVINCTELMHRSIKFIINRYRCEFADHSVHAPSTSNDPWTLEFPGTAGFHIKAVDGVFNLYRDEEFKDKVAYPYLHLEDFVQDMNSICAMMADGPL